MIFHNRGGHFKTALYETPLKIVFSLLSTSWVDWHLSKKKKFHTNTRLSFASCCFILLWGQNHVPTSLNPYKALSLLSLAIWKLIQPIESPHAKAASILWAVSVY